MNTFHSSGKAISSLGRDVKAFAPCRPMFSPPREHRCTGRDSDTQAVAEGGGGPMMMFVWSVAVESRSVYMSAFILQTPFPPVHV